MLFIFKYMNFLTGNLNRVISSVPITNIALAIEISFFTFQGMSYVIDVYRGKGKAQRNILNVGLYISLFSQLIAGPIVRYETIEKEIDSRSTSWDDFCTGVVRFLTGLFKKNILANNLANVADIAFTTPSGSLSVCMAWLGILCFTLQIFFDFSGYSDMSI